MENPCQVFLVINSKEYFEYFENEKSNKKHKGVKNGASSMEFENFASRINSRNGIEKFGKEKVEKQEQHRLVVKGGCMRKI